MRGGGLLPIALLALLATPRGGEAPAAALRTIPIQAVRVADDDGSRPCVLTPAEVEEQLAFANRAFTGAGLRFVLEPGELPLVRSTLLNRINGKEDASWRQAKAFGNQTAARYPGKLVLFFRYGPGERPSGNGFSWCTYSFAVMSPYSAMSHCGHPHVDALAHELGHHFGLPHTFAAGPFPTEAGAGAYLREHNGDPKSFDGDGFADTPPDPGITAMECGRAPRVVLEGVPFALPRRNLMSYYDERASLSPQQAERVRWLADFMAANGMGVPTHAGLRAPLEVERLEVLEHPQASASTQPMAGFEADHWSADAQLFCAAEPGGGVTLALPVARTGRYRLDLYATRAPDFAAVQAWLDGTRLGTPANLYAPLVLPSGRISLGTITLTAGTHRLGFQNAGRDPASRGAGFGLDALELAPTP